MGRLGEAFVEILPNLRRWGARLRSDLESASQPALRQGERRFTGFVSRIRDHLFSLSTAMAVGFGAAAVGLVTKFGLKTAASLQQAQISFETLLGSARRATKFIDDLKKFAASTPFELPGLVSAARQLLGAGAAAKDVIPILTAYGDASGALGLSQEQFQRIMLAVTQTMNKGKIQAEELLQVTEAGLPVYPLLARALGMPVAKIQELSSQGKLLAADVLPKLQAQMEKDYGGAMAKQSQTLNGLWSTFMDTLNLGLADALKPLVPILQEALPGAMRVLSSSLKGVSDFIARVVVPTFQSLHDWLGPKLKAAVAVVDLSGVRDRIQGALASVDWSVVGDGLKRDAQTWAASIMSGIQTGIDQGNWEPLGRALGDGVARAIDALATTSSSIVKAVIKWGQSVDWFAAGEAVGSKAAPFAVGFAAQLGSGLVTAFKEHPFDFVVGILSFIGVGKAAGWGAKILSRIPGARFIFKPLIDVMFKWDRFTAPVNNAIGRFLSNVAKGFLHAFQRVFPGIGQDLGKHLDDLVRGIGRRVGPIAAATRRFVAAIPKSIGEGLAEITIMIGRVIVRLTYPFRAAGTWLIARGAQLVGGLLRGIAKTSVAQTIGNVISHVVAPFRDAGSWLLTEGRQLVGGLLTGIRRQMANVGSWIKVNVVDPVVGAVKHFFGIKSPSTVMAGIGGHLVSGLVRGVVRANPIGAVKKIFGGMPGALRAVVGKGLVSVTSLTQKALGALGTAFFGGAGGGGGLGGNAASNRSLAMIMARAYGWTGSQFAALDRLIMGESGWRSDAQNPTSSAYGIFQFLNSTWGAVGASKTANPAGQIAAGLRYIAQVYGSPAAAYAAWSSRSPHWYDGGGVLPPGLSMSYNGTGQGELVAPNDKLEDAIYRAFMRAIDDSGVGEVELRVDGEEFKKVIKVESKRQVDASASALKVGRR
jgi:tape measure domain-containing protein